MLREPNNADRADWAQAAVDRFREVCRGDIGDAVADLLCNIMHLCARDPETYGKFSQNLYRAEFHFEAETTEEANDEDDDTQGNKS